MRLKIFIFGLIVILMSACRKDVEDSKIATRFVHKYGFDISKNEWKERGKNGQIIRTLPSGICETTTYKNGVLNGETTITYPRSTAIQELQVYENGILVKKVNYELSGLPILEALFDGNKKKITSWNKNGVPLSIEEYKDGLLSEASYFDEKNEKEASVINGKGTRIKRNRENILLSKEDILDGKIIKRVTFHPNGNIQSKSSFLDYQLHGLQETFSKNGKPLTRSTWSYGKLDGMHLGYRNGNCSFEIPYVDGKKDGIERHFNDSGDLVKEIHWQKDHRHGSSRYHHGDYTDIQWYWKGMAVDLKKFQMLEFREKLIAEINDKKDVNLEKSIK